MHKTTGRPWASLSVLGIRRYWLTFSFTAVTASRLV